MEEAIIGSFYNFPVMSSIAFKDIFSLNRGYSPAWLIVLYIFGAYFKEYEDNIKIKTKNNIIIIIGLLTFTIIVELLGLRILGNIFDNLTDIRNLIIGYVSIITFVQSVLIF